MNVFSPFEMLNGNSYAKRQSSGEWEGGILCPDCDNKLIGGYEDYVNRAMYGGILPSNETPICKKYKNKRGVQYTNCKKISYKKTKIFFLTILWRASISKRPFFNEIKLGPHEEVIRKMILEENAGDVSGYPILFQTFINDSLMSRDIVGQPQKRKTIDGHTVYVFIIGGMIYTYFVNSKGHKLNDQVLTKTIKPTNEMIISHIPPGKGWDVVMEFCGLVKNSKY